MAFDSSSHKQFWILSSEALAKQRATLHSTAVAQRQTWSLSSVPATPQSSNMLSSSSSSAMQTVPDSASSNSGTVQSMRLSLSPMPSKSNFTGGIFSESKAANNASSPSFLVPSTPELSGLSNMQV